MAIKKPDPSRIWIMALLILSLLSLNSDRAATPGLPFTEDFSDTALRDDTLTNANWSTEEQALYLAWWDRKFGVFGPGVAGLDITADADATFAVALGDMDGDGDLDLVVGNATSVSGNPGMPNRLYLNSGNPDPWLWVTGSDITADAGLTVAVALGDVDGDGDLDLVAGNYGETNRLYLNNGTSDPFNGVAGLDITADVHLTEEVALADVEGDGDLDLVTVTGAGQPNRLYLNGGGTPISWSGSNITSDTYETLAMALGDVDGDGDLDLVTGTTFDYDRLYLNDGTSNPWGTAVGIDFGPDPYFTFTMALGDVDGDGDLDLVIANDLGRRLYLNNGTADPYNGVTPIIIPEGFNDGTQSVLLADMDADGDLDLIAGNNIATSRLYLNNGTTDPWTGVDPVDLTSEFRATLSLAVGDVDGDGDLDLVEGNQGRVNELYLNNGASNPWNGAAGTDITADTHRSTSAALGDVDGDGDLDLVVGDYNEPNRLYLNNGTPDPWNGVTGTDITADAHATGAVALSDVDGDGDLDLVAGNWNQVNRVYLNNGTSDPWNGVTGTDITADAHATGAVALGDVDGDGDLDLVVGNSSQVNRLYLHNGTSDPWNGVTGADITASIYDTRSVVLGDVDGDGDLDLVTGNWSNEPNRLYLNNGTSDPWNGVTGTDITADDPATAAVVLGDLDGDGDLDLVVGNSSHTNRFYLNNGTADPWNGAVGIPFNANSDDTRSVALGDVDADGDLDVVEGNGDQAAYYVHLNGRGAPISWTSYQITSDEHYTSFVGLGDIDGDGDLDLAAANYRWGAEVNRLYLNNGAPVPWLGVEGTGITADAHPTRSVAVGDVDSDGDPDLVAGNSGVNRLYLNNGTRDPWRGVAGVDITTDAENTWSVALGDLDGDGYLDLVTGNDLGQSNRVYLNDGDGDPWDTLISGTALPNSSSYQTFSLALDDVNGDSDVDVFEGNSGGANRIYSNSGGSPPTWTESTITTDVYSTWSIAVADMDQDGDRDVVVGNENQANRIYFNDGAAVPTWSGFDISADTNTTRSVVVADVEGDGDLDILAGNDGQVNRFYASDSSTWPPTWTGDDISTETDSTRSLAVVDWDRDGDPDLVVGNQGQPNRLYLQDPSDFIMDITADTDSTQALTVGDLDRDGLPDIVAGNLSQPNRFYRHHFYDTAHGRATSLEVDATAGVITNATVTAIGTLPNHTGIDFWLSNNGGAKWFQAQPGVQMTFPTSGNDLRWRAELRSASPVLTPLIDEIQITSAFIPSTVGDRVWLDLDADGIQDPSENGLANIVVALYDDAGFTVDIDITDSTGDYSFPDVPWNANYSVRFIVPPGYALSPADQGGDDALDSDPDAVTGYTPMFRLNTFGHHTRWDAGMVAICTPPDETIYLYMVTLSTDGNDYPILHFMDANQPGQVTGYNIYRSHDAALPINQWTLEGSDVIDMDEGTPNQQWVDSSGDVSPTDVWFYQVTAYNNGCPVEIAEGPF